MEAIKITVSSSERFGLLTKLHDVIEPYANTWKCIIIPISADSAAVVCETDEILGLIISAIKFTFDDPITIEKLINL